MHFYAHEKFDRLPDAILFDIDDTLYAYGPAHEAALSAVCAKVVKLFSIKPRDFDAAFSRARMEIKKRLANTAASHSRLLYFKHMLECLGLGSQVLTALDLEQTYWRNFLNSAVLFDEVGETFNEIRLNVIPLAFVTDLTAQIQMRKMIYFGIDTYADLVITSEEAGCDKCGEVPYHLAVEKLSLTDPLVWMVGDNPMNDIFHSRRSLNAVTLQKLNPGANAGEGETQPDASFREFSELRSLIASLSGAREG